MSLYLPPLTSAQRWIGARQFDFSRQIAVMAIINRTPDSFFDHGRTFGLEAAVTAALAAAEAGADWVDIGGLPFSPMAAEISAAEEIDRVVPVVESAASQSDAVISVDTFRAEVAAASIAAGAAVINDTTGLADPGLAEVVADTGVTLVITHSLAAPRQPYPRPSYTDVVAEVRAFLAGRIEWALSYGIAEDQLVIDPGPDLNKNTLQTLEICRRFAEIADLGLPALAAVSNKDFIGETLDRDKDDRLEGSLTAATFCLTQGARIIRIHDVRAAVACARMTEAILGWRRPAHPQHNMF